MMSSGPKDQAPGKKKRLHVNRNRHQNVQLQRPLEAVSEETGEVAGPSKTTRGSKRPTSQDRNTLLTFFAMRHYLQQRYNRMISMNWRDSDVRPYKELPAKRIMPYRIRRVVSPFEFYLEYAEGYNFQQFFPQMQTYYEDRTNVNKMALVKGTVLLGRCYVCKDFTDNKWYRVRAHKVNHELQTVLVFFCDLGKLQEVPFCYLLEIDRWFTRCSAQLFRAYLYDLLPASSGPNSLAFSDEACNFFKGLVSGKEFDGIVMARSDMELTQGLPDFVTEVGVVLFEKSLGAVHTTQSCSINAQMVDNGYAKAIGVLAGCKHTVSSMQVPESKFDMDEMEKLLPQEQPSVDNEIPRLLGQREIGLLWNNPTELVSPPDRTWLPDCFKEDNQANQLLGICLPKKLAKSMAHIKLSYVLGPEMIILHMHSQLGDMHKMQQALGHTCSKLPSLDLEDLYPGTFVACHMTDNSQKENADIWCRAILKGQVNHSTFKLLLVDYGNEITLLQSQIRPLPDFFQKIPSFAHRVHLDVTGLKPCGSSCWSSNCSCGFRRYVFSWEQKEPIYFLYQPHHSNWIELDDFTQGIIYKFDEDKWVAGPRKNIQANQPININKEHVLLRSLFNTVGVDIHYEVMVPGSAFWHFQTVVDMVVHGGFGFYGFKSKNAQLIHLDILEHSDALRVELAPDLTAPDANAIREDDETSSNSSSATVTDASFGYNRARNSASTSSQFTRKSELDSTIAIVGSAGSVGTSISSCDYGLEYGEDVC